jgi:hypothetical protein
MLEAINLIAATVEIPFGSGMHDRANMLRHISRVSCVPATVTPKRVNVRFGSKAHMCAAKGHVRFTPESDTERVLSNPRRASGHCRQLICSMSPSSKPRLALGRKSNSS